MTKNLLVWLGDRESDDPSLVGNKTASLGQLGKLGIPILPGFVVTTKAYQDFTSLHNLDTKVSHLKGSISDETKLRSAVKKEVESTHISKELIGEILKAYLKLSGHLKHAPLLLQSSDSGQSQLIIGEANLLIAIKKEWNKSIENYQSDIALTIQLNPKPDEEGLYHTDDTAASIFPKEEALKTQLIAHGNAIKKHSYFPRTIQWVVVKGNVYITGIKEFTSSLSEKPSPVVSAHTATKIYVTLSDNENVSGIAVKHIDGALMEGIHRGIISVAKVFSPRPVFYLLSSNDLNEQLESVKNARNKENHKNIFLVLPPVTTVARLQNTKQTIASTGLYRSPSLKFYMSVETPAQITLLEEFFEEGIDGVILDTTVLTYHVLGLDLKTAPKEQDITHKAVLLAFAQIIHICHKHRIPCIAIGRGLFYPHVLRELVALGVSGVGISDADIDGTRQQVARLEKEIVHE